MADKTRAELEELKVGELKELAKDAELEGYSSMNKAELVDALASDGPARTAEDHLLEAPEPDAKVEVRTPVEPGTVDPAIVERRDAIRKAQERPAGRVRPVPAKIDPRLVEAREVKRAEQDALRDRPATAPPAR